MVFETVLFAIRAGLKLGQKLRDAFIQSTQQRELTLPLPSVDLRPDFVSALGYFNRDGAVHLIPDSPLKGIYDQAYREGESAPDAVKQELLRAAQELWSLDQARLGGADITLSGGAVVAANDWVALLTVRQWQRGEIQQQNRTMAVQVVGTLVEIGIDYFAQVPGALNANSKQGKVLKALVDALDTIPFANIDPTTEKGLRDLVGRLFIAAMETVAEQPGFITGDAKVQDLVKVTAKGLAVDIAARLTALDSGNERARLDLLDWGELVFASVLHSAGELVLSQPQRFLGIDDQATGAVVTKVGNAILGLAIDTDNDTLRLQNVIGREGLNTIAKAALTAVAENPDIFGRNTNQGVRNILVSLAQTLAASERLSLDMLPELARVVLAATAKNLALIWPGGASRPEKHLLLTAAQKTLEILAAKPPDGATWTPTFTGPQMLEVVQTVVDELAANPGWLLAGVARIDANLVEAIKTSLDVLRTRGNQSLSPALAVRIVQASIKAVVLRQEFIDKKLSPGTKPLVADLLDRLLSTVLSLDPQGPAAWQLLRDQAIVTLVTVVLDVFARNKLSNRSLPALETFLADQVTGLAEGGALDWDRFRTGLDAALARAAA